MVSMGTSLADGVWGRDSAVYRITGVFAVIGGWFFTAVMAFVGSAIIATIIYFGGHFAVLGLVGLVGIIIWRTHVYHAKQTKKKTKKEILLEASHDNLAMKSAYYIDNIITKAENIFDDVMHHIQQAKRKALEQDLVHTEELRDETKTLKMMVHDVFADLPDEALVKGNWYVRVVLYLRKVSYALRDIANDMHTYLSNEHPPLLEIQHKEL